MVIDLFPAVGEEPDQAILHGGTSLDGPGVFQEPLLAQAWLDGDIGPLAEADIILVGLLLGQEAEFTESLDGLDPCLESVESRKSLSGEIIERSVGIHDVDHREMMPQADLVIGLVMGWRNLQDTGAEFKIDRLISDDRELVFRFQREGTTDMPADEVGVAPILRIHRNRRVTHDRLGTGGGDFQPDSGTLHDLQLEVVEIPFLLPGDHLLITQRREGNGAPVDHPLATVNESLSVEINEDFLHLAGIGLIHGESLARPVAGATELLQLVDDDATMLLLPVPDFLEKGFAAQIVAGLLLLLAELPLHDGLRGDTRMVGAGKPENLMAGLAGATGQNILERVIEHMAQGQDTGDIRRRNDQRVGRSQGGRIRREATRFAPTGVPFLFDIARGVGCGKR